MQEFPFWVKTRLLKRRMSVTELARKVRRNRSTVSTAIYNDRFPLTRAAIEKFLGS